MNTQSLQSVGKAKLEQIEITISKETAEDLPGIMEVLYKTWLSTYVDKVQGVTKADVEKRFAWRNDPVAISKAQADFKMKEHNPENENIFGMVAKLDGKIIGYSKFIKFQNNDQLEIIYVLPEYQGKGVGRKFWDEMQKYMTTGKKVIVDVVDGNLPAISWYESLGFVKNGKSPDGPKYKLPVSGTELNEIELEYIPK
jgi:ribosomal protein S18 acetylase RimI-like enzyme